jgi:hypothetical protein
MHQFISISVWRYLLMLRDSGQSLRSDGIWILVVHPPMDFWYDQYSAAIKVSQKLLEGLSRRHSQGKRHLLLNPIGKRNKKHSRRCVPDTCLTSKGRPHARSSYSCGTYDFSVGQTSRNVLFNLLVSASIATPRSLTVATLSVIVHNDLVILVAYRLVRCHDKQSDPFYKSMKTSIGITLVQQLDRTVKLEITLIQQLDRTVKLGITLIQLDRTAKRSLTL